jgi:hypothetical protein
MLDWTPSFENAFWHSSLIVSVVVIVNSSPSIPPGIRRSPIVPVLIGSFPGCSVVLPAELGYRDVRVQGLCEHDYLLLRGSPGPDGHVSCLRFRHPQVCSLGCSPSSGPTPIPWQVRSPCRLFPSRISISHLPACPRPRGIIPFAPIGRI